MFRIIQFLFLFSITLVACRENNSQNTKAIKEEMRQREVIHLTDAQISERAFELGDTLVSKAEFQFLETLRKTQDTSCVPSFLKAVSEINQKYESKVFRMTFEPNQDRKTLTKKENEIMDAYFYNRAHFLPISPNYQKDGDKNFFFTRALVINNTLCSRCHSELQNPGLKGNPGDTIGIWFARFSKKKVVMSYVE